MKNGMACVAWRIAFAAFYAIAVFAFSGGAAATDKLDIRLTDDEKQEIRNYVKTIPVEDGLGQLFMIGLPGDYKNFDGLSPSIRHHDIQ